MRLLLAKIIDNLANIKWDLVFYYKYIFQIKFRRIINKNKHFKNSQINERCFIVGNGPSLNKLDLTKLNKEIVFTVNEIISNSSIYENLNSDFHILIDPYYFNLSSELPEDIATIERLKRINYTNKKPICITSYEGKNAFEKNGLDKILDLYYVFQHRYITESYKSTIKMDRNMPSSLNVIQAAIFSAMYMGFKKIYLIGCDMTFIFLSIESNIEGNNNKLKNFHAYKYSENQIKSIKAFCSKRDNEFNLYELAKTFSIFKRIKKYADKHHIEIVNATAGGALDVFDRIKFESLFYDSEK